jgi:hypothetical protein
MFVMGFGSGMLFLLVTGGVGPSGGLTCVAVLREKAAVAAAAFKSRVEKNVVFYACVAQVTANTCFGKRACTCIQAFHSTHSHV